MVRSCNVFCPLCLCRARPPSGGRLGVCSSVRSQPGRGRVRHPGPRRRGRHWYGQRHLPSAAHVSPSVLKRPEFWGLRCIPSGFWCGGSNGFLHLFPNLNSGKTITNDMDDNRLDSLENEGECGYVCFRHRSVLTSLSWLWRMWLDQWSSMRKPWDFKTKKL